MGDKFILLQVLKKKKPKLKMSFLCVFLLFLVSRRCGRPVVLIQSKETTKDCDEKRENSEDDDEMEVDEPAVKKTKQ